MDTVSGILRIKKTKKGEAYYAEYKNRKGKEVAHPILDAVCWFSKEKAHDGDAITIELKADQLPNKVTLDGKTVCAPVQKPPSTSRSFQGKGGQGYGQGHAGTRSSGAQSGSGGYSGQSRQSARRDATAPYNFIPYDPNLIIDDLTPPPGPLNADAGDVLYSGTLTCRLKALTPLLVCGPQKAEDKKNEKKNQDRRFFEVNGTKMIPGSSLKGMLRSQVEVLSYSHLAPINDRNLVYRNFSDSQYKKHMGDGRDEERKQKAGWLIREGATYTIEETAFDTVPRSGWEKIETGTVPQLKKPNIYYIAPRKPDGKIHDVDLETVALFREQLTKGQETLLEKRGADKDLKLNPKHGCPVFFIVEDGRVVFFGLPRFFRLPYEKNPADFTGAITGLDFAGRLFGSVDKEAENTFRGRVSPSAAIVENPSEKNGTTATLGQPQATCIAHYLVQDDSALRMRNNARNNDPDTLSTYNDECRLRGHKWYWHRNWNPKEVPTGNANTDAVLHPVAEGCTAAFTLTLDRVCLEELGAILEAVGLPEGHAHKLGMGKSLGLGSVRISIESMDIKPDRERYWSLADRLSGKTAPMDATLGNRARKAFKDFVLKKLSERGLPANDYEKLDAIRNLRAMQNFAKKPTNQETAFLHLHNGDPSYKNKAILPGPLEIAKAQ